MKTCVEAISALRFKLSMFGIPLGGSDTTKTDDAAYVYCDNETVVKNSTMVSSTLNKKHSSIAAGMISLSWIKSELNLADAFTKLLASKKRDDLFDQWVY